jgi:signal transduction histidine kinase
MNRKELLFSISEVAQELMQPLTAMNATLEMLSGGYVGDVTPEQQKMLLLAYNSGDHLRHLMEELIAIVGFPTNKGTDKRFHTTSDEVAKLQQNKDH